MTLRPSPSIRKPAGAAPMPPETGGGVASQPRPTRAPRHRAGWALGVAAVAVAGVVALRSGGPADTSRAAPGVGSSAPISEAPRASAEAGATASAATAAAEIREALVVVPRGARVEVDAVATDAPGGQLRVRGTLGSVHRVRVSVGARAREQDVVIAEAGAVPSEIALPSAPAGKSAETAAASWVFALPELRAGVRLAPGIVLGAGVAAAVAIAVSAPTWPASRRQAQRPDGLMHFDDERLSGSTSVLVVPEIALSIETQPASGKTAGR